MNRLKSVLALTAALQLTTMATAPKSDALLMGFSTGNVVLIFFGTLYTAIGTLGLSVEERPIERLQAYGATVLGLVLDEKVLKPATLDRTLEMPPSLSEVYDPAVATEIWSQIKEVDQALEESTIQFEFPDEIKSYLTSRAPCKAACKKTLATAEKKFISQVKTKLEAVVNEGKPEGIRLALSDKTVKFMIEHFGYTFSR